MTQGAVAGTCVVASFDRADVAVAVTMLLVWHPRKTAEPRHRFLRELVAGAITRRAGLG